MRLGFDLDGVIVNLTPVVLQHIEKKFSICLDPAELRFFNIEDNHQQLTTEGVWECVLSSFNDPSLFPYPDVIDFLTYYYLKTNEPVNFITSRPYTIENVTIEWLRNWFTYDLNKFRVHFTEEKGQTVENLNLDVLVEDRKKYALDVANRGKLVFLLNRPWNEDLPEHSNILRFNNILEIMKYYDGLS